jgi:hypothetical protein
MSVTETGINISNRSVTHKVPRQMARVFRAPTETAMSSTDAIIPTQNWYPLISV